MNRRRELRSAIKYVSAYEMSVCEDISDLMLLIVKKAKFKCCGDLSPVKKRCALQCSRCSAQYYPLSGTIFNRNNLSVYVLSSFISKIIEYPEISISDLQKKSPESITYSTAHRLYHLIKQNIRNSRLLLNFTKIPFIKSGEYELTDKYIMDLLNKSGKIKVNSLNKENAEIYSRIILEKRKEIIKLRIENVIKQLKNEE